MGILFFCNSFFVSKALTVTPRAVESVGTNPWVRLHLPSAGKGELPLNKDSRKVGNKSPVVDAVISGGQKFLCWVSQSGLDEGRILCCVTGPAMVRLVCTCVSLVFSKCGHAEHMLPSHLLGEFFWLLGQRSWWGLAAAKSFIQSAALSGGNLRKGRSYR